MIYLDPGFFLTILATRKRKNFAAEVAEVSEEEKEITAEVAEVSEEEKEFCGMMDPGVDEIRDFTAE